MLSLQHKMTMVPIGLWVVFVRSTHTSMEKVVIGVGYVSESEDLAKVCPLI